MLRQEIHSNLTTVFKDVFDDDDFTVTEELHAEDVEEWDSLSQIRIIVAVEKLFGVRFAQEEIERLNNVGDFMDLIAAKKTG